MDKIRTANNLYNSITEEFNEYKDGKSSYVTFIGRTKMYADKIYKDLIDDLNSDIEDLKGWCE